MGDRIPSIDLPKPKFEELIQLPFQKNVFLCPHTKTRWVVNKGEVFRDVEGETEWLQMASYVGKTYRDVFEDSYKYALNAS